MGLKLLRLPTYRRRHFLIMNPGMIVSMRQRNVDRSTAETEVFVSACSGAIQLLGNCRQGSVLPPAVSIMNYEWRQSMSF